MLCEPNCADITEKVLKINPDEREWNEYYGTGDASIKIVDTLNMIASN